MPTYNYEERVKVSQAVQSVGAATCPRCGGVVEERRMQTVQDRLLKRPGKPYYRCSNPSCAAECTPLSHLTAVPLPSNGTTNPKA
jgi:hypothetical protein